MIVIATFEGRQMVNVYDKLLSEISEDQQQIVSIHQSFDHPQRNITTQTCELRRHPGSLPETFTPLLSDLPTLQTAAEIARQHTPDSRYIENHTDVY